MLKISWDQYALEIARVAALRSGDPWVKVGSCILRRDMTVASTGYNGFPQGMEEDWSDRDERRKFVIHAEVNALRLIKPNEGHLIASTLLPCNDCLKSIRSYGIKKVIYSDIYERDSSTLDLAEKMGIELIQLNFLK